MNFDELMRKMGHDWMRGAWLQVYRRDASFERRRAEFYAACAEQFDFENWRRKPKPEKSQTPIPGRDGKSGKREKYGNPAIASFMQAEVGAVETLGRSTLLDSECDKPNDDVAMTFSHHEGTLRRNTLQEVARIMEGAQLQTLQSPGFEEHISSGFGPRTPADYKLDCIKELNEMRKAMPSLFMRTCEDIILRDIFVWNVPGRAKRKKVLQDLRMTLDFAAYHLGMNYKGQPEMTYKDLIERWPVLEEYFYERERRPYLHNGKVVAR